MVGKLSGAAAVLQVVSGFTRRTDVRGLSPPEIASRGRHTFAGPRNRSGESGSSQPR